MAKSMIKPSHRGRLHSALGVGQDDRIPISKLQKAVKSDSKTLRKQAQFAINARKWGKRDGGQVKNW